MFFANLPSWTAWPLCIVVAAVIVLAAIGKKTQPSQRRGNDRALARAAAKTAVASTRASVSLAAAPITIPAKIFGRLAYLVGWKIVR